MARESRNVYTLEEILTPRAKEALHHLELLARRKVDGLLHGVHRSRRKGMGSEFDHHKTYQPGDSLKHVDWKVSARHDRYYVKRYMEETALAVRIVVDRSASMLYSTADWPSKYLHACRAAACLAYLVIKERDSASLALTTASETVWLPAGSTEAHLVRILRALATRDAVAQDNLHTCLRTIVDRCELRGIVAVISDMMYDPAPVQREMARLQAQGHEVLLLQLRDPTEQDFPFNRWVQFGDLENVSVRHRVDAATLKKLYREEYQTLMEHWQRWAGKYAVHFVSFRTDQHLEAVLSQYVAFRGEIAGKR